MRLISLLLISFILIAFLPACRKPNDQTIIKGGKVILTAQVKHHELPVSSCKVFIKDTFQFPGKDSSLYTSYKISDPNGYVEFTGLNNANYYLYAKGYDAAVQDSVWGYTSVTVEADPGEEVEINAVIPVSE